MALRSRTLLRVTLIAGSCASLLLPSFARQVAVSAEIQLNASDAGDGLRLGEAVAISGKTFVAGGTGAYIYDLTPGGWAETTDLNVGLRSNSYGQAVAIEGDVAVVTDLGAMDESLAAGAYVFERDELGAWTPSAT